MSGQIYSEKIDPMTYLVEVPVQVVFEAIKWRLYMWKSGGEDYTAAVELAEQFWDYFPEETKVALIDEVRLRNSVGTVSPVSRTRWAVLITEFERMGQVDG